MQSYIYTYMHACINTFGYTHTSMQVLLMYCITYSSRLGLGVGNQESHYHSNGSKGLKLHPLQIRYRGASAEELGVELCIESVKCRGNPILVVRGVYSVGTILKVVVRQYKQEFII